MPLKINKRKPLFMISTWDHPNESVIPKSIDNPKQQDQRDIEDKDIFP